MLTLFAEFHLKQNQICWQHSKTCRLNIVTIIFINIYG